MVGEDEVGPDEEARAGRPARRRDHLDLAHPPGRRQQPRREGHHVLEARGHPDDVFQLRGDAVAEDPGLGQEVPNRAGGLPQSGAHRGEAARQGIVVMLLELAVEPRGDLPVVGEQAHRLVVPGVSGQVPRSDRRGGAQVRQPRPHPSEPDLQGPQAGEVHGRGRRLVAADPDRPDQRLELPHGLPHRPPQRPAPARPAH